VHLFFCFVLWPTNAQLIDKLLYCSYMFQHYCVILRELVVSTLPSYTSMSMQLLVIQFKISHVFYAVEISVFKIFKIFLFLVIKWLKSSCCYNSHEVLCGGCMYNLYINAIVLLGQYVLSLSVCQAVWRVSLYWLERIVDWVHWSSAHRSISSVVVVLACKMTPNSLLPFLYCMLLIMFWTVIFMSVIENV
jgi:hypothetical protein